MSLFLFINNDLRLSSFRIPRADENERPSLGCQVQAVPDLCTASISEIAYVLPNPGVWMPADGQRQGVRCRRLRIPGAPKTETDCSDNLFSMAMVLASLESARTGKKVFIADLLNMGNV